MSHKELQHLLRVLSERDIPLTKDDVLWAFQNPPSKEALTAWMQEYLTDKTLLTKDEAAFSEREHRIPHNTIADRGRPLSDLEVEDAVASLERSTAAIETQCELLETQMRTLRAIRSRMAKDESAASTSQVRLKKFAREKAQVLLETEELSQLLSDRVHTSSKQAEAATNSVPNQVERILEKDDRLFDGLQKLLPKLGEASAHESEIEDMERLCSVLSALSQKEIRTRLNLIYKKGVASRSHSLDGASPTKLSSSQSKQRETLRAELTELGSEIEGLVSIVVDHRFRKPLRTGLRSIHEDSQAQRARWSEYTTSALMYLAARVDALGDHVQHLHAHRAALQTVARSLDQTLAMQHVNPGTSDSAPTADKPLPKGLKPLRLVQANFSESQDPALMLLRQLDLRSSGAETPSKVGEMLSSAVRERTTRSSQLSLSNEHDIVDAILQSLSKPDSSARDLIHATYAHSRFGSCRLVDDELQTGIDRLEDQTQGVGDVMRGLDTDAIAREIRLRQTEVLQKLGN